MSVVDDLVRDMQLWLPQREALAVLHNILSTSPIGRGISKKKTLSEMMVAEPGAPYAWQKTFSFPEEMNPQVGTEFPSFCFAIATGGGKTRLMGACIAYLYQTKGFKNFFILSKGQTIYNKHRVEDFDPASPKYVFKGLPGFPRPRLIDGDNYERSAYPELFSDDLTLHLFNIEKIFNERTDVEFRFHRFHEGIGGSFADVLRTKPDLVLLMDESHNIRAEQSLKAINALKPILGLEFTATPKAPNVIYTFPLRRAMREGGPNGGGLVKRARIVARRDDDSLAEEREDIKLRDGIEVHEKKKVALETYCRNSGLPLVKPRVLICAPPSRQDQEKKEIERIAEYVQSDAFFGGAYRGKVLAVHQGSDDEQIQKLLDLEKTDSHIEIVLHVNKLKEGWDVNTVYTIIPLRASVSDILTTQTIGRGLRLPFGRQVSQDPGLSDTEREELAYIDTLEIVSHDRYSAVIEKVKASPDWDVAVAPPDDRKTESREMSPDAAAEYRMVIPVVAPRFQTSDDLDLTELEFSLERLEDLDLSLIGADLATLEEETFDTVKQQCQGSLVNYFVRVLLERTEEFDIRDKPRLQKLVRSYIRKAQIASGDEQEVLFKNRGKVAADMLEQIRHRMQETTRVVYRVTSKKVEFRPYWRTVPKGSVERHKDAVLDDDARLNIIGGYRRTIFTRNVFESKQEKWLADILDNDAKVVRWVRPPTGQMPIAYKAGSYNPDFLVELSGHDFLVLEVKARGDLQDDDVVAKALAARAWCDAMSRGTRNNWEYRLIPDDGVKKAASLQGVLSAAVSIQG
ncbi:MAG: hypothetical protein FJ291_23900 [Planctomycetes bacterium]|nr:hypothetical protein [Planctomycetota bacterium]